MDSTFILTLEEIPERKQNINPLCSSGSFDKINGFLVNLKTCLYFNQVMLRGLGCHSEWWNACPICTRPWIQFLALKKNKLVYDLMLMFSCSLRSSRGYLSFLSVHMDMCNWRLEVIGMVALLYIQCLSLTWPWSSLIRLGANVPQRSACLCQPRVGHHASFLMWVLGIKLLCLHGKHFSVSAISNPREPEPNKYSRDST